MKIKKLFIYTFLLGLITAALFFYLKRNSVWEDNFLSYTVDTKSENIEFYWRDEYAKNFKSILNLKTWLEAKNKKLTFAMNGGMFKKDNTPVGLYIQEQKTLTPIDTARGDGNFYLNPNGIFYITSDNQAVICKTGNFSNTGNIKLATQSGPMLVFDGEIHPSFKQGSDNLNIRNGVGILPDNKVIFVMSKVEISFYDFAKYFKDLGCKNALYLDGFVSRTYLPEKNWIQTDGDFGVIIGVTKDK